MRRRCRPLRDSRPFHAQLYASLGLTADDNNRLFVALARSGSRTVIRALRVSSNDGTPRFENAPEIPVTATSVRLRVVQSGAAVTLSYDAGAGWVSAAQFASLGNESYAELTATAVGVARDFTAAFSDFQVVSGTTSWRRYARGDLVRRADFMAGTTGGDSMGKRYWGDSWKGSSPFPLLKANGMGWFASDLRFTSAPVLDATPKAQWASLPWQTDFWRSRELVAATLKEAQDAGLRLYVQLLLSGRHRLLWPTGRACGLERSVGGRNCREAAG